MTSHHLTPVHQRGDRAFKFVVTAAGYGVLIALVAVAAFLVLRALPALTSAQSSIGRGADEGTGEGFISYVLPLIFGTVWASIIALCIAVPIAVGVALFITQYAPPQARTQRLHTMHLLGS